MKRNDATFNAMVARLAAGELTRQQAAEEYGVNYGTLCVWLGRSKLNDSTARKTPKAVYGAAVDWAIKDPDKVKALDAAVAKVLAGEISALAAAKQNPDLSARTIADRVRRARVQSGLPVQHRTVRADAGAQEQELAKMQSLSGAAQ